MRATKLLGLQLRYLYCQLLLLLPCLGSRELLEGQAVDCTLLLRSSPTNISLVQPCVTSSAGAPVVFDGSRRFESSRGGLRPVLDLAFKSSTVLLLPPGAGTEIVYANFTGVRLAKLAPLGVQLLLAVSVQPSASLLLTDVVLETDCSTLARYQQWIADYRTANLSTVDPSGDVAVRFWKQSGITLTNCTITCRRPPAVVTSYPPAGADGRTNGSETTATAADPVSAVAVSTDVDLYNALALAPSYGNRSGVVFIVVARNLTLSSPLWSVQGVELLRNVSVVGGYSDGNSVTSLSNITSMESHVSDNVNRTSVHAAGKPVLDLQARDPGLTGTRVAVREVR